MSFETYDVYFSGKIIKGHEPEVVQQKIGILFKLKGSKLERLFSGEPVAIKKGIDMDQAVKYRVAFRDAGALVDIRPVEAPQTPDNLPAKQQQAGAPQALSLSPPNSFDLSDCVLPVTPQQIPDISGLELEKPGNILDESPEPVPLVIDTSDLQLAKPGVNLGPPAQQPTIEIHTDNLQLSPANQGSLEEFQPQIVKVRLPNIDHLHFVKEDEAPKGKAVFEISED